MAKKIATVDETPNVIGPRQQLPGERFQRIALSDIATKAGFNPRSVVDPAYAAELAENIRANGLINPLTVCPTKPGSGKYYVVAGACRLAAVALAGQADVLCVVRDQLDIDSPEALAIALAENDDAGRKNLEPMDQARAYQRLADMVRPQLAAEQDVEPSAVADFAIHKRVAKVLGRTAKNEKNASQHVRVTLRLLDAPPSIQELIDQHKLSKQVAITLGDIPQEVRDRVASRLRPGMVEGDVRRLANEVRREDVAGIKTNPSEDPVGDVVMTEERANRPPGQVGGVVLWRSKPEIRAGILEVAARYFEAKGDGSTRLAEEYANQLSTLLWVSGGIESRSTTTKQFSAAVKDLRTHTTGSQEDEDVSEPTGKKAAKAGKSATVYGDD